MGLRVGCKFFQIFTGSYIKFIDSGVFRWIITKFEVFFGNLWTAKHIFLKV
jgi:hypothetical protein